MQRDLKRYADELRQEKAQQQRTEQQEVDAQRLDLQARERRVRAMAQKYLAHAQGMRTESAVAVHLLLKDGDGASFTLDVGKPKSGWRGISAQLQPGDRWVMSIESPISGRNIQEYNTDVDAEAKAYIFIRPLFEEAMRALIVDGTDSLGSAEPTATMPPRRG